MNILFFCLSFSTKTSKNFYEDLLREFQMQGHNVYVACANEKRSKEKDGIEDLNGINVLRIRTGNITGTRSLIEKGLSTITIDYLFTKTVFKYWGNIKFDLILYPTPPITLAGTVAKVKKRTGAKTYLLLKDIFPQNAIDLGMLKKSGVKGIIYKSFKRKEKKLYLESDYIGCMSPANVKYLLHHNDYLDSKNIEVCPNCEKPLLISYEEKELRDIRNKYNIPQNKKVFVYGGNLGKPQGIEFFLECLDVCKSEENAFMLVVGGGSEATKIKSFISENHIQNARILNELPKDDYEKLVCACDVGLVFLDYRFTFPNFPSRILSYMQASKPVIVATDPNTDMGDIVEKNGFGWKCLSKNPDEFLFCVRKALESDLTVMGKIGRRYLEDNYNSKNGFEVIIKHLKQNK